MSINVALSGRLAVGAVETLEKSTVEPATFHPIRKRDEPEQIKAVLERAEVLVGDWPDDAVTAPNLRLVQQIGAGVDNYNLENFPTDTYLCNVYFHGPAIAEHIFLLLLALNRNLSDADRNLRKGRWPLRDSAGHVNELDNSTLGIIGFGHIGKALLKPARAFGMDIMAVKGSEPKEDPPDGVSFFGSADDLYQVLSNSDAVVLSVPLTDQTRGLIDEPELETMKDSAYLLNVARGPVVDENALYQSLVEGKIAGAGIDTWYQYPEEQETCFPSKYPFHTLDNVVMTPHISGWSDQTAQKRWTFIAKNIDRIARNETPENVVSQIQ